MADPLPAGGCYSISGDDSFSITVRIYYTYKVTVTTTISQNGCCGEAAPPDSVDSNISAMPASDFTHTIPFIAQKFQFGKIYNPVQGALQAYLDKWTHFQNRLESGRSDLVESERVVSTVKSPPIVCVPASCVDGVSQSAITCRVVTTTKRKKDAESVMVNRTVTSSDAVCSFT